MKTIYFITCGALLVALSAGCTSTKVYTTTRERVDIEVEGNQGVIYGPTPSPRRVTNTTREIIDIDIEFATGDELKKGRKETVVDEEISGNAGNVSQKRITYEPTAEGAEADSISEVDDEELAVESVNPTTGPAITLPPSPAAEKKIK